MNYQNKINESIELLDSINSEINKLPDINILESKSNTLTIEYNQKSAEYREFMQEYNNYQIKIAQSQKDIEILQDKISNLSDNLTQLEDKKIERESLIAERDKYDYFYRLFSPTGIIVNILSDAIMYINDRLSIYSNILLEKDYHIELVKGKISLKDSTGASYQSLSNGEKRRLDISIQFALHDYIHTCCGMQMDCCFIDEILDTLDDIGVDNIFEILRLKLEYCNLKSIYVITHNDKLKDKFDQVITVKKDINGNSKVAHDIVTTRYY